MAVESASPMLVISTQKNSETSVSEFDLQLCSDAATSGKNLIVSLYSETLGKQVEKQYQVRESKQSPHWSFVCSEIAVEQLGFLNPIHPNYEEYKNGVVTEFKAKLRHFSQKLDFIYKLFVNAQHGENISYKTIEDKDEAKRVVNFCMDDGCTPLLAACASKKSAPATIKQLISFGAKIDSTRGNRCALSFACERGDYKVVEAMLNNGANPNPKTPKGGISPLAWAVLRDDNPLKLVTLLLDNGADVDGCCPEFQSTPLMESVHAADIKVMQLLLQRGAKVDFVNSAGRTALFHAIANRCMQHAQLLIDYDANLDVKDKKGETPFSVYGKAADEFESDATVPAETTFLKYAIEKDCWSVAIGFLKADQTRGTQLVKELDTKKSASTIYKTEALLNLIGGAATTNATGQTILYFALKARDLKAAAEIIKLEPKQISLLSANKKHRAELCKQPTLKEFITTAESKFAKEAP
ncbi:ankyrin repeat domain-containing protein [Parashewanella spongiae]|uniref:Ankyrin repeat domain-containing protein n=1 Tax=Parashewanella spongiae TaxID=342950 RepID=A0A3A6TZN5_9GAMM|nr:ankyrin repeat domain-containing protein [Parashewanella spongiae]MCL1079553.1 ankyrin repeat domain-containing protein [Parashewanella spongiae]RJY18458.1 ankyrin repeat domain-containing protein [Parashewanella spongiae]